MEFRILGPLEVIHEDDAVALGGIKPRAILAILLLHANEPVSAERLALAIWGGEASAGSVKTVQVHVSRLRKALGDAEVVTTTPAGYRLRVRPGELDAERFERLVEDGRRALAVGQAERAAGVLRDALELWRGPPLADLEFESFAQTEIARLEEQRLAALEARMEAELAAGRHSEVLGELRRLVAAYPVRERFAGLLMLALFRCGRQAEALDAYRGARRHLVAEIGVEPGPELRSVHEAILRHDASLELRPAVADLPRELDRATMPPLVGREAELSRLRKCWDRTMNGAGALVGLIGARGSGKTCVAADLAGEAHTVGATVLYAAGTAPVDAVLATLRSAREASRPTLLVVDDADKAHADVRAELGELTPVLATAPVLALASATDPDALVWPGVEEVIALEPLDAAAVRAIAVRYAPGRSADEVPAEWLLDASEGVAGRVHDLAARWARREAARRVGAFAGRAEVGRGELRSIEAALAGGIIELEAARERVAPTGQDEPFVMCPFKGLACFEASDTDYFFGRERVIAQLVARLVGAPMLGVVGPSGSGKSSVVRAGLLPALTGGVLPGSERWQQVLIRPREQPLQELRQAIADIDRDRRLVLAVDQFEEIFTACEHEDERAAFIAELVRVAQERDGRAVVILVVRADQYGRCAEYPDLASLLAANHALVGAMRPDELRRAIECPAQRAELYVEPALTDALVADVEDEPGALPLLSTALLELWQRRDGRRLRRVAYEQTGGVRGAVARLAEDAFRALDPAQQEVARSALMRLVAEGTPGAFERRRVPLSEIEFANDHVARVVAVLTDRRLLTVSGGTVEVAHEALLREWPRLRGWLDEDEQGRRIHRHVTDAAREWDQGGRDAGDLYRGARLATALEWRAEHEQELNRTERAFLDAGRAAELSELEAAKRRTRRLRAVALGLAALVVVAAISAVFALREKQRAESERRTAVSRSLATQALSRLDQDVDLAALLSLEAYRAAPTIEARDAVLSVLPPLEHAAGALRPGARPVTTLAVSPDGETLASADTDGTLLLWDVAHRRRLGQPLEAHTQLVSSMAFSPDGDTLALAGELGGAQLWDVGDRRPLGQPLGTRPMTSAAFSRDTETLAAAGEDGTVRLWDVGERRLLGRVVTGYTSGAFRLALSPDAETLAVGDWRGRLTLWNVSDQRPLGSPVKGHTSQVTSMAFSPDGDTLATGGADSTVRLWDVGDRRPLGQPLKDHTSIVWTVAFSSDGDTLASAGADGTVRLWDVGDRRSLDQPLEGHAGDVYRVAFSADRNTLVSAGRDGSIRLWNLDDRRQLDQAVRTGPVQSVVFSPDGKTLASASPSGMLRLWSVENRRPLGQPLKGQRGEVTDMAFTRDGDTLASVSTAGTVRLWSVADRRPLGQPLKGQVGFVNSVALSSDGDTLALAGADGLLRLWSVADRRQLGQLRTGPRGIGIVAFSGGGDTLATGDEDGTIRLWDVGARRPLGQLPGADASAEVSSLAFSPDGDTLASAGNEDGSVRLWDVGDRRPLGQPLKGHTQFVLSVAFSPDGDTLASAGADNTVRLWDVSDRRPLGQPLKAHTWPETKVTFSPKGQALASSGPEATLRLWDSILWSDSPRALQRRVCASVRRNLSRAEWTEFLPDEPYRETCARD